jgi:hypothetical protein
VTGLSEHRGELLVPGAAGARLRVDVLVVLAPGLWFSNDDQDDRSLLWLGLAVGSPRETAAAFLAAYHHDRAALDLLDPTAFTLIGVPTAPAYRQPPAGARLRPVAPTAVEASQRDR